MGFNTTILAFKKDSRDFDQTRVEILKITLKNYFSFLSQPVDRYFCPCSKFSPFFNKILDLQLYSNSIRIFARVIENN